MIDPEGVKQLNNRFRVKMFNPFRVVRGDCYLLPQAAPVVIHVHSLREWNGIDLMFYFKKAFFNNWDFNPYLELHCN